jgi:hypothetical protein
MKGVVDIASDVAEQLIAAMRGLLTAATGRDGNGVLRMIYQEDMDRDHSFCAVCEEIDRHKEGCAVGFAERVLRVMQLKT